MKVTVCQLHDDRAIFAREWEQLVAHVRKEHSELVLLPEMPFCRWFAGSRSFDSALWNAAVQAHNEWELRLHELAPAVVLGSRPIDFGNERYNEAFVWDTELGSRAVHAKSSLADEDGAWEGSWYNSATPDFVPLEIGSARIGFLMCSELRKIDEVQRYKREGVHVLATPCATRAVMFDLWLADGRAACALAGAYGLASNRVDDAGEFGGQGWIISPRGEVLGLTSRDQNFLSAELDLDAADRIKASHSRRRQSAVGGAVTEREWRAKASKPNA